MQTIAIATLFRDDMDVARNWVESFNSIQIPSDVSISLRANSESDSILSYLMKSIRREVVIIPVKFKAFDCSGDPESLQFNRCKAEHVMSFQSNNIKAVARDFLMFWDDDITVKGPMVLCKLLDAISKDENVVNVIGMYPDRIDRTLSYVKIGDPFSLPAKMSDIKFGDVVEVSGGSPGFSLFRSSFLKEILPLDLLGTVDTDNYISERVRQAKKKCLCHGGVRLNHG